MPGTWHNKMEEKFPSEIQEVKFVCSSSVSKTSRRADILLDNRRTFEIQHSYISEEEIVARCSDWDEFGKEIIWLVDGNTGVDITELSTGNYLLIFAQKWKYRSFEKTYDFILLDTIHGIFKIELKNIRSGIIELKETKTVDEVIHILTNNSKNLWKQWADDNFVKSTLGVYQQGAGNGKTYNIWKSILENTDRKTYVIVTKQHSARNVIYQELKDQQSRHLNSNGEELFHIKNIEDEETEEGNKHYIIEYIHRETERKCIVVIGTIDSFCFNLSHSNSKGSKFFEGIVNNIAENGSKKLKNGYMNFGGRNIQLSKESEVWIDEVQDLPENYLHAMIKLMYETQCYMNVVGDKLQSLSFSKNFLTEIAEEGLPNIKIDKKEPINKNRRIKVTNMDEQINALINFREYDLPKVRCVAKDKTNNDEPIKIISSPIIYANDTNNDKISTFCNNIMDKYKHEVETNNYAPNDFLIIFPIMKGNVVAPELQTKIQNFWADKEDPNNNDYIEYVVIHKHTEGTTINTDDSVNATRIMSIQSSKGDGRKVVFILGVTEKSLKVVSNKKFGLLYESHLHVALTRAEKQIYFGLIENNDDIHKRFGDGELVPYLGDISKTVNLDKINEFINKDELIKFLDEKINKDYFLEQEQINPTETVDWGYHCIKYQTYYYQVILNIVSAKSNKNYDKSSQLFTTLDKLSKLKIEPKHEKEFWEYLDQYQYNNDKNMDCFPLCKLSDQGYYKKYFKKIGRAVVNVKDYYIKSKLHELDTYHQIVLTYMIQIYTHQRYADMNPMDIYNITDYFTKNKNKEKDLLKHIENVKSIIESSGINNFENMNWNIYKHVALDSSKDYFKISKLQYPILGNNDTDIIHIVLKSDISHLNFWDIIVEILLERFLLYNPAPSRYDNKKKFENKNINTYLFLLDKNRCVKIDWDWDKEFKNDIQVQLKETLKIYFESNHRSIFNFLEMSKKDEKWTTEPGSIIDSIIDRCDKMYNCPQYINKFFDNLKEKIDDGDDYDYIDNYDSFNNKLMKKLDNDLTKYFKS